MPDSSFHTADLHGWLTRIQAGDRSARDELIQAVCSRLERLARRVFRGFPNLRPDADTADVLQGSLIRLTRALETRELRPGGTREFVAFAATCIRSELLDLARRWGSARRGGNRRAANLRDGSGQDGVVEPVDQADDPAEMERWCAFHEAVEKLPTEEREVVSLTFYHGWAQTEIAQLLQVSERQVRRYWRSACVRLHEQLGGEIPPATDER